MTAYTEWTNELVSEDLSREERNKIKERKNLKQIVTDGLCKEGLVIMTILLHSLKSVDPEKATYHIISGLSLEKSNAILKMTIGSI